MKQFTWLRRAMVAVIGFTILLIGGAMIVLPGPAIVFIPLGLGILATEFVWAKRLMARARDTIAGKHRAAEPEPFIALGNEGGAEMKSEESFNQGGEINRRVFCNRVVLTSIGVGLAANSLKGEPATEQTPLLVYPPMKIEGAERVMPGSFLYFSYPTANDPAVFVRGHDGESNAYSRKCAHRGCSVDYDAQRRCIKCPCHQGAYDPRTGYVMFGPPPRPLDQIVLQMRAGGEVWAVGKRIGSANSNA